MRSLIVTTPAFSALLCAAVALSLPAAVSTSPVPDLAFCVPLSPRCFNSRRAHVSTGEIVASASAASRHLLAHADCVTPAETRRLGPSLDSPTSLEIVRESTPRKHLGPTAEEIVAQRRKEALVRKTEVLSSWR